MMSFSSCPNFSNPRHHFNLNSYPPNQISYSYPHWRPQIYPLEKQKGKRKAQTLEKDRANKKNFFFFFPILFLIMFSSSPSGNKPVEIRIRTFPFAPHSSRIRAPAGSPNSNARSR